MTLVRDIDREAVVAGLVRAGEAAGGVERDGRRVALRGLRVPPAQGRRSGRPAAVAA